MTEGYWLASKLNLMLFFFCIFKSQWWLSDHKIQFKKTKYWLFIDCSPGSLLHRKPSLQHSRKLSLSVFDLQNRENSLLASKLSTALTNKIVLFPLTEIRTLGSLEQAWKDNLTTESWTVILESLTWATSFISENSYTTTKALRM